jgi:hypothetical protein
MIQRRGIHSAAGWSAGWAAEMFDNIQYVRNRNGKNAVQRGNEVRAEMTGVMAGAVEASLLV